MGCYPREIITLQVGHYSNFIGTHWWNLQEASFVFDDTIKTEINHNFLFRRGCLPNKEITYTPRLVVVDFRQSLGCLPLLGTLYNDNISPSVNQVQWDGKLKVEHQFTKEKNKFLQVIEQEDQLFMNHEESPPKISMADLENDRLEEEIEVWSDFLHTHLHPKSVFTFNNDWEQKNDSENVWAFQNGVGLMQRQDIQDEIEEKIRFQAESCDSLQGFHMLCDCHDGMGGVSSKLAEYLQDEYCNKDVFSFMSIPPHFNPSSRPSIDMYLSSLLQCYLEISKFSTMVTPLNMRKHSWHPCADNVTWPHLNYDPLSAYQTSSILSSFLETLTTSYRTKENPMSMMHLSELLTPVQRKFVSGSLKLPLGIPECNYLLDSLQNEEINLHGVPISGGVISKPLSEVRVIRGIKENRMKSKSIKIPPQFYTFGQYLQMMLSNGENPSHFLNKIISDPLHTPVPYPHIFKNSVTKNGWIDRDYKRNGAVSTVSSTASLQQSQDMKLNLEEILKGTSKLDVNRLPKLTEANIDRIIWKEIIEEFTCLIENYGPLEEN